MHPIEIEKYMLRGGGQWKRKKGGLAGEGSFFHYKRLQQLLWPEKMWHRWNELLLREFIEHRIVAIIGPASSGKTREASDFALTNYYVWPDCSTVLVCSTEREMLEMRAWGEMKSAHKLAKVRYEWTPGKLIESRQRIVTDDKDIVTEGRDFRNGIAGVAAKKGGQYVGMTAFIGVKNKRVMLIVDEAQFLPRAFVDSISNLNKNTEFKCIVMGNPKDATDSLGAIAEPSAELGGWDGGVDQTGKTKTWPTRFPNGECVQLVGSDSPNMDVAETEPVPFPFLITRKSIADDVAYYGRDSLQFSMMDEGRMPRGEGNRRVLTRQMCLRFGAMEQPVWKDDTRVRIGFLDAACGGEGGDRTVFGEMQMGLDKENRKIVALVDTLLVPIDGQLPELPEDQITLFVQQQCKVRNIPPENFGFDSTGRGILVGSMARLWSPNIIPVEFGGKPTDRMVSNEIRTMCKDYYSKFVTELWFSVRLAVLSRQFRGMTEDVLLEFCMREWKLIGSNKTEVEPKKQTKIKVGRSPDLADAVCVGLEIARRKGFVVEKSVATAARDDTWKRDLRDRAAKNRESWTLEVA